MAKEAVGRGLKVLVSAHASGCQVAVTDLSSLLRNAAAGGGSEPRKSAGLPCDDIGSELVLSFVL